MARHVSPKQAAPISDRRVRVKLKGGRYEATVRPANFDELANAWGFADWDDRIAKLYDLCAIDGPKPLHGVAKRAFGYQISLLSGGPDAEHRARGIEASEVSPDDLSDEAADVYADLQAKGIAVVCIRMEEQDFIFLEPLPGRLDAHSAQEKRGAGIDIHRKLVVDHIKHGDLTPVLREKPFGILSLANALVEIGGGTLEAELGEA